MKKNNLSYKITLLGLFLLFICVPVSVLANPPPEPGPGDYVAESCNPTKGWIRDGDVTSTYSNDGQYLKFEPQSYQAWISTYDGSIEFDFYNWQYDKIKFDFIDSFSGYSSTVNIKVVYTTGSPDYFPGSDSWPNGYIHEGYYEYNLDDSRIVDYVRLHIQCYSFDQPPRYIYIDMIRLTIL